jgi:hypothetical protein
VLWRAVPGFLVLARSDGARLCIEGPGSEVWELLGQSTSLEAISAELAARYGAPVEEVRHDVGDLLGRLVDDGYVDADG